MTGWREAMNADIVTFFGIEYPNAEVEKIEVTTKEVGDCWTCKWTQFYVEVTFSTDSGAVTRSYEGNMGAFLTAVWEAAEKRREEEGDDEASEDAYPGDYGYAHRRAY